MNMGQCQTEENPSGIRVPEDVQIIGYDGIVDYATGRFGCSTIVQPIPEIAETAVKLLIHQQGALPPPM